MARGAYSLEARSVMPCVTLPCHMSIFHSVPPERHGVTTNTWSPMARPLPGLMEVARAGGKRCGFFYNWEPLRNVSQPGSLAFSYFVDNVEAPRGDGVVVAEALRVLRADSLDFAFVYFGAVDVAGHNHGWMSEGYLAQVAYVDGLLGELLAGLPEQTHVLLQADHGGVERSHGWDVPENMTVPWVLAGPGVKAGHKLERPVSLLDTAPTLARIMGLGAHPHWEGRVVEEAFG